MIISVGSSTVVNIVVLHLELQVLVQLEVRAEAIDAPHRAPSGIFAIDIIAAINLQPRRNRHTSKHIPGICLARSTWFPGLRRRIEVVYIVTCMVRIFSTEAPVLVIIFAGESPTPAFDTHLVCTRIGSRPSEEGDIGFALLKPLPV